MNTRKISNKVFAFGLCVLSFAIPNKLSADDAPSPPVPELTLAPSPTGGQEADTFRMNILKGSQSKWSAQLNFSYSGPSVKSPFAGEVPNPGHQVPPPLVTLSGTVSGRYRFNEHDTGGLGLGAVTQTPFQGPKNTTFADPYTDFSHSYQIGPIKNRADFQITLWTNKEFHDTFGYRFALTAFNESYYTFDFKLTTGLQAWIDKNFFASGGHYDASQQIRYDIYLGPYVEYPLSKSFNFRTIFAIPSINTRNSESLTAMNHLPVAQTLGVAMRIGTAVYFFPYLYFFPGQALSSDNTTIGFTTVINLF